MAVNNADFDVIVVGAGPAGSFTAGALARAELRVALLEEHPRVGLPNHCSGLVSPRTLELAGIDREHIALAPFSRARVWGPSGKTLWLQSNVVQAVAIDRPRFDQALAERAAAAGAELLLGTRARRFERTETGVRVEVQAQAGVSALTAPLLVGADGANSRVARWMGFGRKREIVPAYKADVVFHNTGSRDIEIFVGNRVAPGLFGWIIPLGGGAARVGIGATESPRRHFERYLEMIEHHFGPFSIEGTGKAPLPVEPAPGFSGDRVMLVGAAARQTKPTTGGGIYFGLRAAELAATTAVEAFEQDDFSRQTLSQYETRWHHLEGQELVYGYRLRRLFCRLSDGEFDLIVRLLSMPFVQETIGRLGDIDYASHLFSRLMALIERPASKPRPVQVARAEVEQLTGMVQSMV